MNADYTNTTGPEAKTQPRSREEPLTVYTIGHSNHPLESFLATLDHYGIDLLVDVRSIPASRHNPQYGKAELKESLHQNGISYLHMPNLGGRRRARLNSENKAWRNTSFRGFADYMQTGEFDRGIAEIIHLAQSHRIVLMCAEAVPWRCHRSLIADALIVRGVRVIEILGEHRSQMHTLNPWARTTGKQVTYPPTSLTFH